MVILDHYTFHAHLVFGLPAMRFNKPSDQKHDIIKRSRRGPACFGLLRKATTAYNHTVDGPLEVSHKVEGLRNKPNILCDWILFDNEAFKRSGRSQIRRKRVDSDSSFSTPKLLRKCMIHRFKPTPSVAIFVFRLPAMRSRLFLVAPQENHGLQAGRWAAMTQELVQKQTPAFCEVESVARELEKTRWYVTVTRPTKSIGSGDSIFKTILGKYSNKDDIQNSTSWASWTFSCFHHSSSPPLDWPETCRANLGP